MTDKKKAPVPEYYESDIALRGAYLSGYQAGQAEQAAGAEPVYVIVNRERFSPKEEFLEIENSAGESVHIPSTPDSGGRRIGPLYTAPQPPKAVPDGLVEFAKTCLSASRDGCDMDGGDIQELALKLGLIESYTVTKPCGSDCVCAEVSDFPLTCYRDAGPLLSDQEGES